MFGTYSYFWSVVVFVIVPVVIEWIIGYRLLKKYLKTTVIVAIFGLLFGVVGESVALSWGAWAFSPEKSFNIRLGAEIETYLYSLFIPVAISSAVIVWTYYEDCGRPIFRKSVKELAKKLSTIVTWRRF